MHFKTKSESSFFGKPITLSPPQILALLFLSLITIGGLLLKLPVATEKSISWIDSFFFATSAATVTGLVPTDTGTTFTLFGEIVILFLIQIGGIGIMSFAVLGVIMLGKKISFKQRRLMQEALNQPSVGGVIRLVKNLVLFSLIIEFISVCFMSLRFIPEMGWSKGIYYSVFHTISAFNNAGYALWPDSLSRYVGDPIINLVVTFLIISGGIGFTVLIDLLHSKNYKKLSLHSKVMIIGTLIINSLAILFIYIIEYNNPATLGSLSEIDKLWAAYFQGITPRTAGFNTIDIGSMEDSSILFTILLMFIGAGSASTGGGIKLTTFIVILFAMLTFLKGSKEMVIGKRTISNSVVFRALAITTMAILFVFFAFLTLTITEKAPFDQIFFEVVSAFGTVGLSMGLTGSLTTIGKIVIIFIMFIGKVGPLTLAFSLARSAKRNIRYPDGEVFTG